MTNLSTTVGWAVIGTPDGFQTKTFGCISKFDITAIVDINNLIIKPFPSSEIICLYREKRTGSVVSYYILYNHAKEVKTDRPGTFSGCVLVLVNHTVNSELIIQTLKELATSLAVYLSPDQRFLTSMTNMEIPQPSTIAAIINSPQPLPQELVIGNITGLLPLVNSNAETQAGFLTFASRPILSKSFNRIYASSNQDVIGYVKERSQIKLIDPGKIDLELVISQLKTENDQLRISVSQLQKENEKLVATNGEQILMLKTKIEDLQSENNFLNEKLTQSDEIKSLQRRTEEKESELRKLKISYDSIRTQNLQLSQQIADEQKYSKHRKHNVILQNDSRNRNNYNVENSKKQSAWTDTKRLNSLNNTKIVLAILLVLIIGTLTWVLIQSSWFNSLITSKEEINSSDQSNPSTVVSEPSITDNKHNNTDEAYEFYKNAVKKGNIYDPEELNKILKNLKVDVTDSSHLHLLALQSDFAGTGLPFEKLSKITFEITQPESVQEILKDVYEKQPKTKAIHGFKDKLMLINGWTDNEQIKPNTTATYYIPK